MSLKPNFDALRTMAALVKHGTAPKILYQKLSEKTGTWRIVEPYRLVESGSDGVCLHCWQLDPDTGEPVSWRMFRIDRIVDVLETDIKFEPRRPMSFTEGLLHSFQALCEEPKRKTSPVTEYREQLLSTIADGSITDTERTNCVNMSESISTKQRKVVHAQVFQQVLFDVLLDGSITDKEDEFLSDVRSLLDELGWSP